MKLTPGVCRSSDSHISQVLRKLSEIMWERILPNPIPASTVVHVTRPELSHEPRKAGPKSERVGQSDEWYWLVVQADVIQSEQHVGTHDDFSNWLELAAHG